MVKKIFAGILLAGIISVSGCFGGNSELNKNPLQTYDYSKMHLVQLEEPYEGQPTVTIETTVGTIKAVLYPEYAPNTVKNFVARANEGYYDGKDIYGILNECIFMTGSENEKRNSGVTEDGQPIPNEYSVDLWTLRGAMCSYYGASGYGDSRFFIVDDQELTEDDIKDLRAVKNGNGGQLIPEELLTAFTEKGCVAGLAGRYTVFGQTIEGFDVIEKICRSETRSARGVRLLEEFLDHYFGGDADANGEFDSQKLEILRKDLSDGASETYVDFAEPAEPIYINSITVGEYHAGQ